MDEAVVTKFTSRTEFEALFLDCIARSNASLMLFDPDFDVFPLGSTATDDRWGMWNTMKAAMMGPLHCMVRAA